MARSPSHNSGTRIDQCESCGIPLPLRRCSNEEGRTWLCKCGQEYIGELDSQYTIDQLRNVRPEPVIFDTAMLIPLPAEMLEYIRTKINIAENNVEKRTSFRHQVILQMPAQAFDQVLRPEGRPFLTVARDLSTNGIGLIHGRAITAKFLALELVTPTGEHIQVLMQVLRCRPRGPYHDIAGQLVTRLASSTSRILR